MIKRTICFSNPVALTTKNNQLFWSYLDDRHYRNPKASIEQDFTDIKNIKSTKTTVIEDDFLSGIDLLHNNVAEKTITNNGKYEPQEQITSGSIPIEDIGILVLDDYLLTISQGVISKLLQHNVALITCNERHMPTGLMLNLEGNTLQSHRWQSQIDASAPLKKQLWQHTIQCKIANQAHLLQHQDVEIGNMKKWELEVKSGDGQNHEARAAVYYWKKIFIPLPHFVRDRDGLPPNQILNYGYSILRATMARSLVGSGLLPTLGIFHKNQYNTYCLADDIMEPYRPIVDQLVIKIISRYGLVTELTTPIKKELLKIPALDVIIDGQNSPLMVAVQRTTASLVRCYEGSQRKILYPLIKC
jgi:CRISP-associated protein Cas1